jgi:hypothetical protein
MNATRSPGGCWACLQPSLDDCTCTVDSLRSQAANAIDHALRATETMDAMQQAMLKLKRDTGGHLIQLGNEVRHWKANHDNQVAIKRALTVRADLPADDWVRQCLAAETRRADDLAAELERDRHRASRRVVDDIIGQLGMAISRLGAGHELLSIAGSYGDTLSDEDVLRMLTDYNEGFHMKVIATAPEDT